MYMEARNAERKVSIYRKSQKRSWVHWSVIRFIKMYGNHKFGKPIKVQGFIVRCHL